MNNGKIFAAVLAASVIGTPAFAQDTQFVPKDEITLMTDGERKGIDGMLSIGANLNFASNSNVVGQTDGFSTVFGLNLKGGLDYLYNKHEVRNTLSIQEGFARTPVIDEFIKTNDVLEFESLYSYFFLKWMGAFGRLSLKTSILPSESVTSEPVDYAVARLDGTIESVTSDRLELADPFSPLSINQSVGAFLEPIRSEGINASFRLGFGARQTFANGVLANKDDAATADVIEIIELDDVFQAGAETFLGVKGRFYDSRLNYEVGASALVPFINNDDTERSAFDLMRYGLTGSLSTSVFSWMSLSYEFRLLKDPQLIDALQVQNGLLLTFNYNFIERAGSTAGPSADEQLAEAKKQLAAAEAECADLREDAEAARVEAEESKKQELEAEHQKRLEEERLRIEKEEQEKIEQPPTDGEPAPTTDGQTPPATDGQTPPATDGQTPPATDGQTPPATDGQTAPQP